MTTVVTPPEEPKKKRKRQAIKRFIDRNRMNLAMSLSFLLQLCVVLFWRTPSLDFSNKLDHLVDEVAFIDNVQIQEAPGEAPPDDGEIELTEKKKVEVKEDPRISGAQDAAIVGATAPIDLTPNVKPEYTEEARAQGITGTITLEVVIADTGEVLQVRSVGKKLGAGLEESAIATYKKKRFSPSILEGKAITVKVLVPIRFTLN
ncbi:MAG: energy transducer TonB [Leptospiraceae bacterium]|nr:energy transducer TonB [Leptospiraceae bacterium]